MRKGICNKYSIRRSQDYTILINIYNSREIYLFDGVAKTIIDNLDKSNNDIVKIIRAKYNVTKECAERDLNKFINNLLKYKILEVKNNDKSD